PVHFDDLRLGKLLQGRFYSCRKQNVVGIEEEDYIPATPGESGVQGRVLAAVLLEHGYNSVAVTGNDLGRAVRGAVVHHNDLRIPVSLVQGAVDGLPQETPIVVVVE